MDLTFAWPGAMGDQAMATLDDADWSEESHMDECDPGAPLDIVAEANTRRYDDFTHWAFVQKLHLQILPNDEEHCEGFDTPIRTFASVTPTYTSMQQQPSLMKLQGPLANLNGPPCLASSWPG